MYESWGPRNRRFGEIRVAEMDETAVPRICAFLTTRKCYGYRHIIQPADMSSVCEQDLAGTNLDGTSE
nr:hypothetical protein GCM10017611_10330 [Rhodococcus wratislaviensis]